MTKEIALKPAPINADGFAPFGQVIAPAEDGKPFGPNDAQLVLTNGTPRLYIMRLLRARASRREESRGIAGSRNASPRWAARRGSWRWRRRSRPTISAAMPDPAAIRAFRVSRHACRQAASRHLARGAVFHRAGSRFSQSRAVRYERDGPCELLSRRAIWACRCASRSEWISTGRSSSLRCRASRAAPSYRGCRFVPIELKLGNKLRCLPRVALTGGRY